MGFSLKARCSSRFPWRRPVEAHQQVMEMESSA
jgi:hypothetical protein